MSIDETSVFHVEESNTARIRKTLKEVYDALEERGYNPVNQIVGYISNHKDARNKMKEFDRCEVVEVLLKEFQRNS